MSSSSALLSRLAIFVWKTPYCTNCCNLIGSPLFTFAVSRLNFYSLAKRIFFSRNLICLQHACVHLFRAKFFAFRQEISPVESGLYIYSRKIRPNYESHPCLFYKNNNDPGILYPNGLVKNYQVEKGPGEGLNYISNTEVRYNNASFFKTTDLCSHIILTLLRVLRAIAKSSIFSAHQKGGSLKN